MNRTQEKLLQDMADALDAERRSSCSSRIHELITIERDTGNSNYVIYRDYRPRCSCDDEGVVCECNGADAEAVAIRLESGERLMRGGGAVRKHGRKDDMDAVTLYKSRQRARSQVRRKCFAARMDRMLTLTFRENVTDLAVAWECFKYFSRLMKWRYKDRWFYVAVPEYQKRGAVHFHLAISGYFEVNTVRKLWRRAAGAHEGNIDITSPRKTIQKNSWNPRRIAQYLSKYVTKNETVGFNQRRYSSGGDIPEPEVTRGWVAFGMPLHRLFAQIVQKFTRKSLAVIWEAPDDRGLFYCST